MASPQPAVAPQEAPAIPSPVRKQVTLVVRDGVSRGGACGDYASESLARQQASHSNAGALETEFSQASSMPGSPTRRSPDRNLNREVSISAVTVVHQLDAAGSSASPGYLRSDRGERVDEPPSTSTSSAALSNMMLPQQYRQLQQHQQQQRYSNGGVSPTQLASSKQRKGPSNLSHLPDIRQRGAAGSGSPTGRATRSAAAAGSPVGSAAAAALRLRASGAAAAPREGPWSAGGPSSPDFRAPSTTSPIRGATASAAASYSQPVPPNLAATAAAVTGAGQTGQAAAAAGTASNTGMLPDLRPGTATDGLVMPGMEDLPGPEDDDDILGANERLRRRIMSLPDMVCRSANGDIFIVELSGVQAILQKREIGSDGLALLGRVSPALYEENANIRRKRRNAKRAALGGASAPGAAGGGAGGAAGAAGAGDAGGGGSSPPSPGRAALSSDLTGTHPPFVEEEVRRHVENTAAAVEAHRASLEARWRKQRAAGQQGHSLEREEELERQRQAAIDFAVHKFLPAKLGQMARNIHIPKSAADGAKHDELMDQMKRELSVKLTPRGGKAAGQGATASKGWGKLQHGIERLYESMPFMQNWADTIKQMKRDDVTGWDELLTQANDVYVKGRNEHQGTNIYVLKCQELGVTPSTQVVQQLSQPGSNMAHCKLGRQGAAALRYALAANSSITHLSLADNGMDAVAVQDILAGLYSGTLARQPGARKKLEKRWQSLDFMHRQPGSNDLQVNLIPQHLAREQEARATAELTAIQQQHTAALTARKEAKQKGGQAQGAGAPGEGEAAAEADPDAPLLPDGSLGDVSLAPLSGSLDPPMGASNPSSSRLYSPDTALPAVRALGAGGGSGAGSPRSGPSRNVGFNIFCSITSLDLSENPLGLNGVRSIADMLDPAVTSVQFMSRLHLNKCGIPEAGGRALVGALMHGNSTLTELRLSNNSLGSKTAGAFGELLALGIAGLRDLDLSWNQIKSDGAKALASGLAGNTVLARLDLSWNGLENDGAIAMGLMLMQNSGLIMLDLTSTRMGAEACLMLSEGIKKNASLEVLILNGNSVGDDGARYLMSALKANNSLQYLGLQGSNMSAAARGHSGATDFNPLSPDGNYTLNLASAPDRAVAMQLCELDAGAPHGADLMKNIRINDKSISSAKHMNWPAGLPTSGTLTCDFITRRVRKVVQVMEAKKFQAITGQLGDHAMGDKEKLNLVEVLVPFNYLYCMQAAALLRAFTIGDEMVIAAALLFTRCVDLDDGVVALTEVLPESSQEQLHLTLGWYSYARFTNPTGHYELSLSNKVQRALASRLKDVAHSEPEDALNWINIIHEMYTSYVKVPNNFGPPESWKSLVPNTGSLSFDYVSSVLAPEDAHPVPDQLLNDVLVQDLGISLDANGMPIPEKDFDIAQEQVARLRPIVANMYFTAAQVKRLVEAFEASPHRVEVLVTCFCLIVDRKAVWQAVYTLRPMEQALAMWRLGPANLFDRNHPTCHYVLDLANPAHEQVTRRLVDLANASSELPNFWNIRINGARRAITENRNMWGTFTAESFTPFLEFDFIGTDGFEVLGRTKADMELLSAGDKLEMRTKQARRLELSRLKTMYAYYEDGSGWQRPIWQSRQLLMKPQLDKAPWAAAWDRMLRLLVRYELRASEIEGDSPLEDLYFNGTAGEDVMTADQFEALLRDWGYNRYEVAHYREAYEAEGRQAIPSDGPAFRPPPPGAGAQQHAARSGVSHSAVSFASRDAAAAAATRSQFSSSIPSARMPSMSAFSGLLVHPPSRPASRPGSRPTSRLDALSHEEGGSDGGGGSGSETDPERGSGDAAARAALHTLRSGLGSPGAASGSRPGTSSHSVATVSSAGIMPMPPMQPAAQLYAGRNTVVEFPTFVSIFMTEPPRALRFLVGPTGGTQAAAQGPAAKAGARKGRR